MAEGQSPPYLARDSYFRRRLIDALRLLPIAMFLLWLLPLLWEEEPGQGILPLLYIFGVWSVGIGVAVVLNLRLMRADPELAAKTASPSPVRKPSDGEAVNNEGA